MFKNINGNVKIGACWAVRYIMKSSEEHHDARDVILHVVLLMPPLRGYLNELLAAVLCILLSFIEKFDCFSHLGRAYLIGNTIRAHYNGPVSCTISFYYFDSWRGDDAALLSHVVAETARHCEARLAHFLAPHAHGTDLLAGHLRFELVEHAANLEYALALLWHVRLVVHGHLLADEAATLPCLALNVFLAEQDHR